jgi:hypothetical protein
LNLILLIDVTFSTPTGFVPNSPAGRSISVQFFERQCIVQRARRNPMDCDTNNPHHLYV